MTRTTPEQRAELARLLDAAMPGPWRDWGDMWIQLGTTRALIVAAVNALPALLADLEDAKAERDALAATLQRVRKLAEGPWTHACHDLDADCAACWAHDLLAIINPESEMPCPD